MNDADKALVERLKASAKDRSMQDRLTPGAYTRPPRQHIEWEAAARIEAMAKRIAELEAEEAGLFEARHCPGIPTDCCDYGVVSLEKGKEVCRVWERDDAEKITALLNARPADKPAVELPGREEIIAAIEPLIDRVPMVDASHSRIRSIRAGWITDAILALMGK